MTRARYKSNCTLSDARKISHLLDLLSLSLEEEITGLLVVLGLAALDEDGVPLRGLFGAGGGGGAAAADLDDEDDDLDEVFILLELDLLVFDSLLKKRWFVKSDKFSYLIIQYTTYSFFKIQMLSIGNA